MSYEILKNKTVLYVEDEVESRKMLIFNIEEYFSEIITASNAFEGFSKYNENKSKIDIIVTDIQMPNMSGLELARAIRKLNLTVPIIFLTAYNENSYLHEAIEVFASGFITKPFVINDLLDVLERAVLRFA